MRLQIAPVGLARTWIRGGALGWDIAETPEMKLNMNQKPNKVTKRFGLSVRSMEPLISCGSYQSRYRR